MSNQPNPNRGYLFPNEKRSSDRHPSWKGKLTIDGVTYWLSAWDKTTDEGKNGFTLSASKAESQQAYREAAGRSPAAQPTNQTKATTDDTPAKDMHGYTEQEIPF